MNSLGPSTGRQQHWVRLKRPGARSYVMVIKSTYKKRVRPRASYVAAKRAEKAELNGQNEVTSRTKVISSSSEQEHPTGPVNEHTAASGRQSRQLKTSDAHENGSAGSVPDDRDKTLQATRAPGNAVDEGETVATPPDRDEYRSNDSSGSHRSIDMFAFVEEQPSIEPEGPSAGSLCELHVYDHHEDANGEHRVLRAGTKYDFDDDCDNDRSPAAALVLMRYFDEDKTLEQRRLEVKSRHMKAAIRSSLPSYRGVNVSDSESIYLFDKPSELLHYRTELAQYGESQEDQNAQEHVRFLSKYIAKLFSRELAVYGDMTAQASTELPIEFKDVWLLFKPGTLLFSAEGSLGNQEYVYRFTTLVNEEPKGKKPYLIINGHIITEDGRNFGRYVWKNYIYHYEGTKKLSELPVFPLDFRKDRDEIRGRLIERGRRFISLFGSHHMQYDGPVLAYRVGRHPENAKDCSCSQCCPSESQVHGRVIIDCHECFSHCQSSLSLVPESIMGSKPDDAINWDDDSYLICDWVKYGYVLKTRQWVSFCVSGLRDIEFRDTMFEDLVLPEAMKAMVSAIVTQSYSSKAEFDDFVEGKGRGIIFLLHGPPGVGKTFTAESIAEQTHRPLCSVNIKDLGSLLAAEDKLSAILNLATKWKAIVLLDEADVFLSERKLDNLAQNALVAIMLRVLEYFQGILFLTTNRVEVIDPAFKSRIHFSIAYPELSHESKKEMWRKFALRGSACQTPEWFNDDFLRRIAEFDLNGRQIKNAARVVHCLSNNKDREPVPEDFYNVLSALKSFDEAFVKGVGGSNASRADSRAILPGFAATIEMRSFERERSEDPEKEVVEEP